MCQERCLSKLVQVHRFSDRFFFFETYRCFNCFHCHDVLFKGFDDGTFSGTFFCKCLFFSLKERRSTYLVKGERLASKHYKVGCWPNLQLGIATGFSQQRGSRFPGFSSSQLQQKPKFVLKKLSISAMFLTWQNWFTRISFGQSQAVSSTITRHKGEQGPGPMPLVYLTHQTARMGWQDNWNGGFSFRLKCVVVWNTLLPNNWNRNV